MFPKKLPDLPNPSWKTALAFPPVSGKIATDKTEKTEKPRPEKKPKPIPKVSEKKKKRIKENGSETALFKKVWKERPHACETCGKVLTEAKPHNFDHVIPKSMGEKYRLDPKNISILCFGCHYQKTTGQIYKGINLD